MSDDESAARFGIMDYVVFSCLLLVSALIGLYYGCSGGKQKTQGEWLAGNRDLDWLPTSLSLLASFISAITLLGTPSELYTAGSMYFYLAMTYFVVIPVTACFFMPVFRRANSLSAFMYIERRFNKTVSLIACSLYIVQMVLYMGIVLYSPALALNAVTGLSLEGSIVAVSLVCIFYTVVGGMKAIIWTDALQTMVMILGMIIISIAGTYKVGGISAVYEITKKGYHLEFDNFSLDPRVRHSGTDLMIGGIFTWLSIYAANQAQVQRYISVGTKRDAQKAIFLNLPGLIFLMLISGYCGLLAYTKYALCDPIKSGIIQKPDQILPYFVTDTFATWPGFGGLFVSSIFSGSLSTISSGVNALAAVVLTNLIPEQYLGQEVRAKLGKLIAVVFGLLALGFAFICKYLDSVLQLALSLFGLLAGPLLGLFTLGMASRRSNGIGATVGYITSLLIQVLIYWGSQTVDYSASKLILYDSNCTATSRAPLDQILHQLDFNQNTFGYKTDTSDTSEFNIMENSVFRLSYMWYGCIGFTWTVVVGYLVSLIVRVVNKSEKETSPDEDLLFHFHDIFPSSGDSRLSLELALGDANC